MGSLIKHASFWIKILLRNLYYTFIYPYLIYCIEIWGNTNDIYLDQLIKIQKKYMSNLIFTSLRHYSTSFQNLNILNFTWTGVPLYWTQRIALLVFKYHKGMLPEPINNLFSLNSNWHNYHTRQTNDLQINTGSGENVSKLFSSTETVFGTTFQENSNWCIIWLL